MPQESQTEKYNRMCFTKVRYPSAESANVAAKNSTRTYRELYSAYTCPFCHTWHIGHNPKKDRYREEHKHEAYLLDMRKRKERREEDRRKRPKKGEKKRVKARVDDKHGPAETQES